MKTLLVVAGQPTRIFDRLSSRSAKGFVANGKLIAKPLKADRYEASQAQKILEQAHEFVSSLPENEPIEFLVLVADYGDASTQMFADAFFPFGLVRRIEPFSAAGVQNANQFNRAANGYVDGLRDQSRRLRRAAARVREVTTLHNTTPLLLPLRNFRSDEYRVAIQTVFGEAGQHDDPRDILSAASKAILTAHPKIKAGKKSAYSDGRTLFEVPGAARHAFFRPSKLKPHPIACLLAARTRFGGSYDPTFHFDCSAVHGGLQKKYPNCHGEDQSPSKDAYVNIAPNDFIR